MAVYARNSMTKRLDYIDWLKGISMIMVIIGHIINFCGLGMILFIFVKEAMYRYSVC